MQTSNFDSVQESTMSHKTVGEIHRYMGNIDPVVVFFPSGNYNQLTELGRYKNLSVAMAILSSFNHPDSAFPIPEFRIFSLETGAEIQVH